MQISLFILLQSSFKFPISLKQYLNIFLHRYPLSELSIKLALFFLLLITSIQSIKKALKTFRLITFSN